jgi:hypothetical protein
MLNLMASDLKKRREVFVFMSSGMEETVTALPLKTLTRCQLYELHPLVSIHTVRRLL